MNHAIFFAPFGDMAEPAAAVELALAAEEHGWDGVFLWDHIFRAPESVTHIGDAWITLAAIAVATNRVRIGPMVTPVIRRRPAKLAREAIAVDRLSGGRLTLGLGLGVNSAGELERFGEVVDGVQRGAMLDEGVAILTGLLAGERVNHHGTHYLVEDVVFAPTTVQQPLPMWFAARGDARRPLRRAAHRGHGLFGIDVDYDGLARMIEIVGHERGGLDGFDIAAYVPVGGDASMWSGLPVTWTMQQFTETSTYAEVLAVIERGRPAD
jgi:alkanesulfonate monooxygenase SsuD/methylene tetrahydromethanopterin reductase-like flavin-dependent oxidoreductase (luciferase family)